MYYRHHCHFSSSHHCHREITIVIFFLLLIFHLILCCRVRGRQLRPDRLFASQKIPVLPLFSSLSTPSFSLINRTQLTWNLSSTLQTTPTASFGNFFSTTLAPQSAPCCRQNPRKTGSAILTRILSTQ